MLTNVSILRRGYWAFDRARLPPDEFAERVRLVQDAARTAGLAGVIVFGDADDYADSAYLSGLPDGTTVVVPVDGEPLLLGTNMWRELPFVRTLTWIRDFRVSDEHDSPGVALGEVIDELGLRGTPLGVVGLDRVLSPTAERQWLGGLAGCEVRPFDAELLALRTVARPREVAFVAHVARLAAGALDAAEETFASGGSNADAYIAAERSARRGGARDFRGLVNAYADDLRPYEGTSDVRREPLSLYVAVEVQGYWADSVTGSGAAAVEAVSAMVAAATAGRRAGDVAAAALDRLPPGLHEAALRYGLGNGIGLALDGPPYVVPGGSERLVDGQLLSLRVLGEEHAAALVEVTAAGGRLLG